MSNNQGNSRIAEYGQHTRFKIGGPNCPLVAQRRASPPWAVKRAVKRIMGATFDAAVGVTLDDLLLIFDPSGRRRVTGVQVLASRLFLMAVGGNLAAMERLTYMTDGPTPTEDEVAAMRSAAE